MDVKTRIKMDLSGNEKQHLVNRTGGVLPVPYSHKDNSVGIHWLRISFDKKHLANVVEFCTYSWGEPSQDGHGLWSYDSRFAWQSGVSLNYDHDPDRSRKVHQDRITLDCPGGSIDEMTANDQQLLINFAAVYNGKCTRIDVFFDDYNRLVTFDELKEAAERKDYSGLRDYQIRYGGNLSTDGNTRREISFGKRGSYGNGKYLRWYDKELESNGECLCDRWEVEFSQKKADAVFKKLAETGGNLEAFAVLCGSLVAGCITFVHRTNEKNISRLDRYEWWQSILAILGKGVSIRVRRVKDSLTGKMEWIKRNVAPSLACMRRVFVSDRALFRWLYDVCHDGDSRMNPYTQQIAEQNENSIDYHWGELEKKEERDYELSKLQ